MEYYDEFYKSGDLPHIQEMSARLITEWSSGRSVALSSMNYNGGNRTLDHFHYLLQKQGITATILDDVNIDTDQLRAKLRELTLGYEATQKPAAIIIPRIANFSQSIIEVLRDTFLIDKGRKFKFYFFLPISVSESVSSVLADLTAVVDKVLIRLPHSSVVLDETIKFRERQYQLTLTPSDRAKVAELSGGIDGVIKKVLQMKSNNPLLKFEAENFIGNTLVGGLIRNLKEEFQDINNSEKLSYGFVDESGQIKSLLLRNAVESDSTELAGKELDLTPSQELLLNLFLEREGQIVTMDEIDSSLRDVDDFSLWGNYKQVARFRKKITPKYKLINLKGRGYKLLKNNT